MRELASKTREFHACDGSASPKAMANGVAEGANDTAADADAQVRANGKTASHSSVAPVTRKADC